MVKLDSSIFTDLILKGLARKALAVLFIKLPVLGWGPIGIIITLIVDKLIEQISQELEDKIDVKAIVFKNEKLEEEYSDASIKLKIIGSNYGIDSEEFKKEREDAVKKFHKFVMFDIDN